MSNIKDWSRKPQCLQSRNPITYGQLLNNLKALLALDPEAKDQVVKIKNQHDVLDAYFSARLDYSDKNSTLDKGHLFLTSDVDLE
jgi:hypothetical protein